MIVKTRLLTSSRVTLAISLLSTIAVVLLVVFGADAGHGPVPTSS